jgi:glycosyltransferase 2 family protein
MKSTSKYEGFLPWIGRALMLFGIFFVFLRLWAYKDDIKDSIAEPALWISMLLISLIYGLAGILLSSGWLNLLRAQGVQSNVFSWKNAWSLYGRTQIAKYIPGNVFHIAGRHVLGNQMGLEHARLITAAVLEIIIVLLSAMLLSIFAMGQIFHLMNDFLPSFFIIILFFLLVLVVLYIFRNCFLNLSWEIVHWPRLAFSLSFYLTFFIISCFLFLISIFIISGNFSALADQWLLILGGYAFAWAVGFVTPGAPGGLGVREVTLLAVLDAAVPGAILLVSVLAFRFATSMGDMVFFIMAVMFGKVNMTREPENKTT